MRYFFSILLGLLFTLSVSAQDARLANQYYASGEYEKAATIYLKLYNKNKKSDHYFNRYIESLLAVEDFDMAEKAIRGEIKSRPKDAQLLVTFGNLFEKKNETEKADKQFQKAIDNMPKDIGVISRIGQAFTRLAKYDLAIGVYEKGEKLMAKSDLFAYKLADLYRRKGETKKMIHYYLNSVQTYKNNINNLINVLNRNLLEEDYEELQTQLYERIQEDDPQLLYYDILEWTFIHRKEYNKAFRQARSVDRQNEENGGRVFEVAEISFNDKDYETAIKAFEYITTNKGQNSSYYLDAKRGLLNSRREKITSTYDYTVDDLLLLKGEYDSFLEEFGRNRQTAMMMVELADLEALYLNDLDASIAVLNEMISFAGVDRLLVAEAK